MPVTGPNGEQGFAPVPMQMPHHMHFQQQAAPEGGNAGGAPVQFVQGPNGFFMPVSAGAVTQPPAAAMMPQPVARPPHAGLEQAGPSAMSNNPFEPQASAQRRQGPLQVPSFGVAGGAAAAAAAGGERPEGGDNDGPAAVQGSPQKPSPARPSLQSSPARPSNSSSPASMSRPDSSNSLPAAGEDGGFRTTSTGSLTGLRPIAHMWTRFAGRPLRSPCCAPNDCNVTVHEASINFDRGVRWPQWVTCNAYFHAPRNACGLSPADVAVS